MITVEMVFTVTLCLVLLGAAAVMIFGGMGK